MKRNVYDCDYLIDQKNIKESIKLELVVGKEMDISGNGYVYDWRYLDLSPKAAEIILNAVMKEMNYSQQNKLWKKIINKEMPKSNWGFELFNTHEQ